MTQLHATALPAVQARPRSKPRILWGPTAGVVLAFVGLAIALVQVGRYDPSAGGFAFLLIVLGLVMYWPSFRRTQAPTGHEARR